MWSHDFLQSDILYIRTLGNIIQRKNLEHESWRSKVNISHTGLYSHMACASQE